MTKENQNTQWKESWRDEYIKWICGFANAQGGTLHIGINDNGIVSGVDVRFSPKAIKEISGETTQKNTVEMSGKIIEMINENVNITLPKIATVLEVTERTVEHVINKLKTENKIERIDPDKGGYWQVITKQKD